GIDGAQVDSCEPGPPTVTALLRGYCDRNNFSPRPLAVTYWCIRHRTFLEQPSMTTRPPPFFIADNVGLDFLNTIAVPVDTEVEWLTSGEDLLAWLEQAGLVPGDVLEAFRKNALPGELDAIATQARGLRDWFKLFVYEHMGRPLEPNALRQLEPL